MIISSPVVGPLRNHACSGGFKSKRLVLLSSLRRALNRREAVLESQCEGDTPVEAGFSGGRSSSALARTSALCSLYVLHRTLGRRYGLAVRYEGTSVDDIPVYGEVCTFLCTRGVKSCAL